MTQDDDGKIALDHPQSPESAAGALTAWLPVDQRGKEDCERCCWAMLMRLPYESVPDFFEVFKQTRRDTRHEWARERGVDFITVRTDGGPLDLPVNAYCIAGVASPTNHPDGHAVFGMIENNRFKLLHDPHPQCEKSGTTPYEYTFLLYTAPARVIEPAAVIRDVANLESSETKHGN